MHGSPTLRRLLAAYRSGEHLHTRMAQRLTGREEASKADRQLARAVNFGFLYGMGADGLKQALAFLWERRERCPGAVPVFACHDEIGVECDAGQAEAVGASLRQVMVDRMAPLIEPVLVAVEVSVGRSWGG